MELRGDPTHTFLVLCSGNDQFLCVRSDHEIPTDGEFTAVSWDVEYFTDQEFLQAIETILRGAEETDENFSYPSEGHMLFENGQHLKDLSIAYEGCPVAADDCGYLGKKDDHWISKDSPLW